MYKNTIIITFSSAKFNRKNNLKKIKYRISQKFWKGYYNDK